MPRTQTSPKGENSRILDKELIDYPTKHAILVLGPSNAGKSTEFINWLLDAANGAATAAKHVDIRTGLSAKTSKVTEVPLHPTKYPGLVLVDTPGLDHTTLSDVDVFKNIAVWLCTWYNDGWRVLQVLYVHNISSDWVSPTMQLDFKVFENLCGTAGFSEGRATIVTFKWDRVTPEVGKARSKQLKETLWSDAIERGCLQANVMTLDDALEVIKKPTPGTRDEPPSLAIVQEMVVDRLRPLATSAGRCITGNPRSRSPMLGGLKRLRHSMKTHMKLEKDGEASSPDITAEEHVTKGEQSTGLGRLSPLRLLIFDRFSDNGQRPSRRWRSRSGDESATKKKVPQVTGKIGSMGVVQDELKIGEDATGQMPTNACTEGQSEGDGDQTNGVHEFPHQANEERIGSGTANQVPLSPADSDCAERRQIEKPPEAAVGRNDNFTRTKAQNELETDESPSNVPTSTEGQPEGEGGQVDRVSPGDARDGGRDGTGAGAGNEAATSPGDGGPPEETHSGRGPPHDARNESGNGAGSRTGSNDPLSRSSDGCREIKETSKFARGDDGDLKSAAPGQDELESKGLSNVHTSTKAQSEGGGEQRDAENRHGLRQRTGDGDAVNDIHLGDFYRNTESWDREDGHGEWDMLPDHSQTDFVISKFR
ncbi:hypothetical protein H1R20_g367, partial [Candolleomyces eurysporus]